MAHLRVDGDDVVVTLSAWEKVGALRGDVRVPKSAIRDVRIVNDAYREVRGMRAPGAGFPGVVLLGTFRRRGQKDFVAVYRHRPGVVVELNDAVYGRIVMSTPDGDALRRDLVA